MTKGPRDKVDGCRHNPENKKRFAEKSCFELSRVEEHPLLDTNNNESNFSCEQNQVKNVDLIHILQIFVYCCLSCG